jgi:hypothetical protein
MRARIDKGDYDAGSIVYGRAGIDINNYGGRHSQAWPEPASFLFWRSMPNPLHVLQEHLLAAAVIKVSRSGISGAKFAALRYSPTPKLSAATR